MPDIHYSRNFVFWAKTIANKQPGSSKQPGIDVLTHCRNVGYVALALARKFSVLLANNGITAAQVAFLASTHDIGKIQRAFQMKCPVWLDNYGLKDIARINAWNNFDPHGYYSRDCLLLYLRDMQMCDDFAMACWALAVGSHHGRCLDKFSYADEIAETEPDKHTGLDWAKERRKVLEALSKEFPCSALPEVDMSSPVLWLTAGLITLADWLASDENFFPVDYVLPDEKIVVQSEQILEDIGIGPLTVKHGLNFKDIFGKEPYELQKKACEYITGPGIYILEAPMGMGKTEAALWAAYGLLEKGKTTGVYFALPTQATSNRMYTRLEDFAKKVCPQATGPRLIHSNSWLLDEVIPLFDSQNTNSNDDKEIGIAQGSRWFASSKRALLAPLGVGTVDQALLCVLATKHFFLRRFALAGKVVILDEVHSYDVYTGRLVQLLCRELEKLGCAVLVLSATLTASIRAKLLDIAPASLPENTPAVSPAMLTHKPFGGRACAKTYNSGIQKKILVHFAPEAELLTRCIEVAKRGAHVLWVCDTVDSAQQVYKQLKPYAERSFDIGLLHSRFPLYLRQELEKNWLDRFSCDLRQGKGAVLVSTQIVEQSVDIDADMLITELAPSDMLLQRIGRLFRHKRNNRPISEPECWIVMEEASIEQLRIMPAPEIKKILGPKYFVYDPSVLLRSLDVWTGKNSIDIPGDIRHILFATYESEQALPPAWEKLDLAKEGREHAQHYMADYNSNISNMSQDDEEGPMTRSGDYPTRSIVLFKSSCGNTWITLHDEKALPFEKQFHLDTAKALAKSSLRLPGYIFDGQDKGLNLYDLDGWGQVKDGEIAIKNLKKDITLAWNEEIGVTIIKK